MSEDEQRARAERAEAALADLSKRANEMAASLDRMRLAGRRMSNVLYNLARGWIPGGRDAAMIKSLVHEWDESSKEPAS